MVYVLHFTVFGHAESVKVALKMYERMQNDGIPVGKMVKLVQDGPNVNKTKFKKMNELIQLDCPESKGLIDLGSCTIHTVHKAFGKGIEQYGKKLIFFVRICMLYSSTVLLGMKIM